MKLLSLALFFVMLALLVISGSNLVFGDSNNPVLSITISLISFFLAPAFLGWASDRSYLDSLALVAGCVAMAVLIVGMVFYVTPFL